MAGEDRGKRNVTVPDAPPDSSISASVDEAGTGSEAKKSTTLLQVPFGLQYQGSSPRKHAKGNVSVSGKITQPTHTPLRHQHAALARTAMLASANSAAAALPSPSRSNQTPRTLARIARTSTSTKQDHQTSRNMDDFSFADDSTQRMETQRLPSMEPPVDGQSMFSPQWHAGTTAGTEAEPQAARLLPRISTPAAVGRWEMQNLQDAVQRIHLDNAGHGPKLARHDLILKEFAKFHDNIYKYIGSLHERVQILEKDKAYYREIAEGHGPHQYGGLQPGFDHHMGAKNGHAGDNHVRPYSLGHRKGFVCTASGDDAEMENTRNKSFSKVGKLEEDTTVQMFVHGLPTPTFTDGPPTANSLRFPIPPTPKPANQPQMTAPTGWRSPLISKRQPHNAGKIMVPANTVIPSVPLTDVELIVYFFNTFSRPMCALRLYARHIGPSVITEILNKHRDIEPPYKRNTCTVKFNTAIKVTGLNKYGPDWEANSRNLFAAAADDAALTDLIRNPTDEGEDVDVLELLNGLKKHPEAGEEGGAGWFTRCVQYCEKHKLNYPLSEIHVLCADLQAGRAPEVPFAHVDEETESSDEGEYPLGRINETVPGYHYPANEDMGHDSDGGIVVDDDQFMNFFSWYDGPYNNNNLIF